MTAGRIRRLALALAVGVAIAALAGCSGSRAGRLPPPAADGARLLADVRVAAAVASALDRIVARDRRFEVDPDDGFSRSGTSGMLLPGSDPASGSGEVVTSQSWAGGDHVTGSVPWRDDGRLAFYVEMTPYDPEDGDVPATRYVDTTYRRGAFDGVTTSAAAIADHGLGAGWQGVRATTVYANGGTLTVRFYTDVADDQVLGRPWANDVHLRQAARHDVVLHDVPPLPAGRDWRSIAIPAPGLAGSLDGVEGRFSCPGAACALDNERLLPDWQGYHPGYDSANGVVFTPAGGGEAVRLSGSDSGPVPEGNYLTLGSWLFAPRDPADVEAFDAGVFAAGRDPFRTTALTALTGSAAYAGKAAGLYAGAAPPVSGTFTADVELSADFGSSADAGAVNGWVSGFALDGGEPSPLTGLRLLPAAIRDSNDPGASGLRPPAVLPGGWVEGETRAAGGWHGVWGGRFFGNGDGDENPTSVAGTFGATDGNLGFAAGFGAHGTGR